jgi:hypothetical protein
MRGLQEYHQHTQSRKHQLTPHSFCTFLALRCEQNVIGCHCAQIGRMGHHSLYTQVSIHVRHDECAQAPRNVGCNSTISDDYDGASGGVGGGDNAHQ